MAGVEVAGVKPAPTSLSPAPKARYSALLPLLPKRELLRVSLHLSGSQASHNRSDGHHHLWQGQQDEKVRRAHRPETVNALTSTVTAMAGQQRQPLMPVAPHEGQ